MTGPDDGLGEIFSDLLPIYLNGSYIGSIRSYKSNSMRYLDAVTDPLTRCSLSHTVLNNIFREVNHYNIEKDLKMSVQYYSASSFVAKVAIETKMHASGNACFKVLSISSRIPTQDLDGIAKDFFSSLNGKVCPTCKYPVASTKDGNRSVTQPECGICKCSSKLEQSLMTDMPNRSKDGNEISNVVDTQKTPIDDIAETVRGYETQINIAFQIFAEKSLEELRKIATESNENFAFFERKKETIEEKFNDLHYAIDLMTSDIAKCSTEVVGALEMPRLDIEYASNELYSLVSGECGQYHNDAIGELSKALGRAVKLLKEEYDDENRSIGASAITIIELLSKFLSTPDSTERSITLWPLETSSSMNSNSTNLNGIPLASRVLSTVQEFLEEAIAQFDAELGRKGTKKVAELRNDYKCLLLKNSRSYDPDEDRLRKRADYINRLSPDSKISLMREIYFFHLMESIMSLAQYMQDYRNFPSNNTGEYYDHAIATKSREIIVSLNNCIGVSRGQQEILSHSSIDSILMAGEVAKFLVDGSCKYLMALRKACDSTNSFRENLITELMNLKSIATKSVADIIELFQQESSLPKTSIQDSYQKICRARQELVELHVQRFLSEVGKKGVYSSFFDVYSHVHNVVRPRPPILDSDAKIYASFTTAKKSLELILQIVNCLPKDNANNLDYEAEPINQDIFTAKQIFIMANREFSSMLDEECAHVLSTQEEANKLCLRLESTQYEDSAWSFRRLLLEESSTETSVIETLANELKMAYYKLLSSFRNTKEEVIAEIKEFINLLEKCTLVIIIMRQLRPKPDCAISKARMKAMEALNSLAKRTFGAADSTDEQSNSELNAARSDNNTEENVGTLVQDYELELYRSRVGVNLVEMLFQVFRELKEYYPQASAPENVHDTLHSMAQNALDTYKFFVNEERELVMEALDLQDGIMGARRGHINGKIHQFFRTLDGIKDSINKSVSKFQNHLKELSGVLQSTKMFATKIKSYTASIMRDMSTAQLPNGSRTLDKLSTVTNCVDGSLTVLNDASTTLRSGFRNGEIHSTRVENIIDRLLSDLDAMRTNKGLENHPGHDNAGPDESMYMQLIRTTSPGIPNANAIDTGYKYLETLDEVQTRLDHHTNESGGNSWETTSLQCTNYFINLGHITLRRLCSLNVASFSCRDEKHNCSKCSYPLDPNKEQKRVEYCNTCNFPLLSISKGTRSTNHETCLVCEALESLEECKRESRKRARRGPPDAMPCTRCRHYDHNPSTTKCTICIAYDYFFTTQRESIEKLTCEVCRCEMRLKILRDETESLSFENRCSPSLPALCRILNKDRCDLCIAQLTLDFVRNSALFRLRCKVCRMNRLFGTFSDEYPCSKTSIFLHHFKNMFKQKRRNCEAITCPACKADSFLTIAKEEAISFVIYGFAESKDYSPFTSNSEKIERCPTCSYPILWWTIDETGKKILEKCQVCLHRKDRCLVEMKQQPQGPLTQGETGHDCVCTHKMRLLDDKERTIDAAASAQNGTKNVETPKSSIEFTKYLVLRYIATERANQYIDDLLVKRLQAGMLGKFYFSPTPLKDKNWSNPRPNNLQDDGLHVYINGSLVAQTDTLSNFWSLLHVSNIPKPILASSGEIEWKWNLNKDTALTLQAAINIDTDNSACQKLQDFKTEMLAANHTCINSRFYEWLFRYCCCGRRFAKKACTKCDAISPEPTSDVWRCFDISMKVTNWALSTIWEEEQREIIALPKKLHAKDIDIKPHEQGEQIRASAVIVMLDGQYVCTILDSKDRVQKFIRRSSTLAHRLNTEMVAFLTTLHSSTKEYNSFVEVADGSEGYPKYLFLKSSFLDEYRNNLANERLNSTHKKKNHKKGTEAKSNPRGRVLCWNFPRKRNNLMISSSSGSMGHSINVHTSNDTIVTIDPPTQSQSGISGNLEAQQSSTTSDIKGQQNSGNSKEASNTQEFAKESARVMEGLYLRARSEIAKALCNLLKEKFGEAYKQDSRTRKILNVYLQGAEIHDLTPKARLWLLEANIDKRLLCKHIFTVLCRLSIFHKLFYPAVAAFLSWSIQRFSAENEAIESAELWVPVAITIALTIGHLTYDIIVEQKIKFIVSEANSTELPDFPKRA